MPPTCRCREVVFEYIIGDMASTRYHITELAIDQLALPVKPVESCQPHDSIVTPPIERTCVQL